MISIKDMEIALLCGCSFTSRMFKVEEKSKNFIIESEEHEKIRSMREISLIEEISR